MRNRLLVLLAAFTATMPATPAAAQGVVAAASSRNVTVEVRENGRIVATSSVRLQLGRPAAISMNGPYAMRLRVDATADAGYTVRPHLQAEGPDGWTSFTAPPLTLAQGEQGRATLSRPEGDLELAVRVD